MLASGSWVYSTTLYLHGENEYPLVEYITSTNESETKQVYIYGATGLIATHQDSTTYTIIKDHLGSTRLVLDEDWAVVSWYDYAPFGKISRSGTGTQLNYRYTGQERDGATGLMNYRARMYDPDLGRFYAIDPAGVGASPYSYVYNNPLSFTDPTGEFPWLLLAISVYNGYKTVKETGNPTDFIPAFTISMITGGVGQMAFAAAGTFTSSLIIKIMIASTASSIVSAGISKGQSDISTSIGPFTYNWETGTGKWSDPFDKDPVLQNVFEFVSWGKFLKEVADVEYVMTTSDEQRKKYKGVIDKYKLDRGVFEKEIYAVDEDHLPPHPYRNLLRRIVSKRGLHKGDQIRYPGGLHWAEDHYRYHLDKFDAVSLGGLGFIPHTVIDVLPNFLRIRPFLRVAQVYYPHVEQIGYYSPW